MQRAAKQKPAKRSAVRRKAGASIKSDFAILDVTVGRAALTKHFEKRPPIGVCPPALRVPVVIWGYIDGIHSHDDGVSREFSVTVKSVLTIKEVA